MLSRLKRIAILACFSLKEYINWYLEEKELQPVLAVDCIPDGALVKHIVQMWEMAVTD